MDKAPGDSALLWTSDEEMLRLEPNLDDGKGNGIWPRRTAQGKQLRDWRVHQTEAMNELARRLRVRKTTAEPFQLGQVDPRSQHRLRPVATALALHFLFVAADSNGDTTGFFSRKASHYWERAGSLLEAEAVMLDYDADNSGTVDDTEKSQPQPMRVIRG